MPEEEDRGILDYGHPHEGHHDGVHSADLRGAVPPTPEKQRT
jgi:hypothetical protein